MNRDLGHARDGSLFAYASLAPGQSFQAELTFDGVPPATRAAILTALTGKDVHLGRSRSAEYGRVRISVAENASPQCFPPGGGNDTTAIVLLLSDTALIDPQSGLPSLSPQAGWFHLPKDWRLDPRRSFLASRRYAPFNGHRRAFDSDRLVLIKGGVLVFTGDQPWSAKDRLAAAEELRQGIGLYRNEGLGQVWLDPEFLTRPTLTVTTAASSALKVTTPAALPDDVVGRWLRRRHVAASLSDLAESHARQWEGHFAALIERLWAEAALDGKRRAETAPARAQWGNVAMAAQGSPDRARLEAALFAEKNAVCSGVAAAAWKNGFPFDPLIQTRDVTSCAGLLRRMIDADSLRTILSDENQDETTVTEFARTVLVALADRMPRRLADMEQKMGGPR